MLKNHDIRASFVVRLPNTCLVIERQPARKAFVRQIHFGYCTYESWYELLRESGICQGE
jgi:hypothetical protein